MVRSDTPQTVLFLSRYAPEAHGPAWERIRHMASASGRVFGNAVVVALQSGRSIAKEKAGSKVLLYEVKLSREAPFPINAYFDPIKFMFLTIHGLLLSLRLKPLFILASMPPSEVGVSAWFVAKISGTDLVVDLRDDWESAIEQKLSLYIPRRLLKIVFTVARKAYSFSRVVMVATQTIGESAERRGVRTPIMLVPNGADTSIFVPKDEEIRRKLRIKYSFPQDRVVMLYCGSGINPYYRLDCILEALKDLPERVGNRLLAVFYLYNGIERVRKMKEALGITDELVEVREPVPRRVLAEVMAACDVGILPFDDSPYLMCARSTKLYEYLGAGLFVVATGPENGELDRLFASNHSLGKFGLPSSGDFSEVFRWVAENKDYVSNESNRFLRHKFIQENHDRMGIMVRAMGEVRSLLSMSRK